MTSTSSRSRRRPSDRAARRVGFNRKTKVFLHIHLDDMTEEEYQATYTTDEDSHNSQRNLVQDIQTIRRQDQQGVPHNNDNEDGTSIRGIEHMRSAAAMQERKAVKEAVLSAVLDEQDRQWDKDADDDEALRSASLRHSTRSQRIAAERARQDALAVRAMMAALTNHDRRPHAHETSSSSSRSSRSVSPMDVDDNLDSSNSSTKSSTSLSPSSASASESPYAHWHHGQAQTAFGSTHATPVTPDNGKANPPRRIIG